MTHNDLLTRICTHKHDSLTALKQANPLSELRARAEEQKGQQRGFEQALLSAQGPAIIAEIKRASPSAGQLHDTLSVPDAAQDMQANGATCLSVLSEEHWFQGTLKDVQDARQAVGIPVLRKDFIVDEWQIFETAAAGADCLLLIVAALSRAQLHDFHALALALGLDVLVEVHTLEELEQAVQIPEIRILGVNNRNLSSLSTDLSVSKTLFSLIPEGLTRISESGIHTPEDLYSLYHTGYQGFLIGHSLMQSETPGQGLSDLLTAVK